ncbi:Hypothetical protein GLP15_3914 [Giardia lamblia P15]|uniref:Uncharacterized protein n=1 Tax=Giardia intestinalis (strain P15) TaxID=658858 RepID=E1F4K0_GIAIA|nr:Hypothetical protein GLP15_3914 [Giardia lamblia P15]
MENEKPGRCRFYPLTSIVWDTSTGISATTPVDDTTYPELLFSCTGRHLVMGPANGCNFLSISLDSLVLEENISIKTQAESVLSFEGRTEAGIVGILAIPNGHILCWEEDHALREYYLALESDHKAVLLAELATNVQQLYGLPHPMLLKMDLPSDCTVCKNRERLCLGAYIADTCLTVIILIDNTQLAFCKIAALEDYIEQGAALTLTSCITSSRRLVFGIFQSPGTLLVIAADSPSTPQTYDVSQVFNDNLLDEGASYTDPREVVLLGLFDGRFAILASYTSDYDSVVAIYNIFDRKLEFTTVVKQYVVSCTVTPYCPGPYDFFFNMLFLNMNDIVSLDFFYFSYAARDNYNAILGKLDSYTSEEDYSTNHFISVLIKSCKEFFQSLEASDDYTCTFIPLLNGSELFGMIPNTRFSRVPCLPEVDQSIFFSPQNVILSSPVISSASAVADSPFIPGISHKDDLIKQKIITTGDTVEWSYSSGACKIKDQIKELITNSCTEYSLDVTLSELPPFHLDSPNYSCDKVYANLAFAHLGGTNQVTIYIETVSRVYISDFLPLYILQFDIRNPQDGSDCISSLNVPEHEEAAALKAATLLDNTFPTDHLTDVLGLAINDEPSLKDVSEKEPSNIHGQPLVCAFIEAQSSPKTNSSGLAPLYQGDSKLSSSVSPKNDLNYLEVELDKQINKKIDEAKEKYAQALSSLINTYATKGELALFLDSTLPDYFATNLSYLSIMKQLNQLRGIHIMLESRTVDGCSLSNNFLKNFYAMKSQNTFPSLTPMFGADSLTFTTVTIKDVNGLLCYRLNSPLSPSHTFNEEVTTGIHHFCDIMDTVLSAYEHQLDVFQLGYRLYWNMDESLKLFNLKEPCVAHSSKAASSLPTSAAPPDSTLFGTFSGGVRTSRPRTNTVDSLDLSNYEDTSLEELTLTQNKVHNSGFSSLFDSMNYKSSYTGLAQSCSLDNTSLPLRLTRSFKTTYENDNQLKIANKFKASSLDEVFRRLGSGITMRMSVKQQTLPQVQNNYPLPTCTSFILSEFVGGVDRVECASAGSASSNKKLPSKRSSVFQHFSNIKPTFRTSDGKQYSNVLTVAFKPGIYDNNNTPSTNASTMYCEYPDSSYLRGLLQNLVPPPFFEEVPPKITESTLCITDLYASHSFETIVEQSRQLSGGNIVTHKDAMHQRIESTSQALFSTENTLSKPQTSFSFGAPVEKHTTQPQVAGESMQQKNVWLGAKPFTFSAPEKPEAQLEKPTFSFGPKIELSNPIQTEKPSDDKLESAQNKDAADIAPLIRPPVSSSISTDIAPEEQKVPTSDSKLVSETCENIKDESAKEIVSSKKTLSSGFSFNILKPTTVQDAGNKSKSCEFSFQPPASTKITGNTSSLSEAPNNLTETTKTGPSSTCVPQPSSSQPAANPFAFGVLREAPKNNIASTVTNLGTGFGTSTNFGFDTVTINPTPNVGTQMTTPVTTFQNSFAFQGGLGQGAQQTVPTAKMFTPPSSGTTTNSVFSNVGFPTSNPFGSGTAPINFNFGGVSNK